MKKFGSAFYCALFFALVLAPLAFMPWAEYQLTENRPPAPLPEVFVDGRLNMSLPSEAEDYLADRFAGRILMADMYSRMVGGVFGVSANDKVVRGSGGWLFFEETVGDYDGTAALSDADMGRLIEYLIDIKEAAQARGQIFLIAVAPNKNTIYGEFMPGRYAMGDEMTNLDRLMAAEGLDLVDLRAVLLAHGQRVYHKTDSHWNGLGARVAAREIMRAIEEKTGVSAAIDWDAGAYEYGVITGDLAQMLYPANPPGELDQIFDDAGFNFTPIGRFRGVDDMHITTASDGAQLSIAMYRDSFADALIPYFSNAYRNAYYTRQTPPPFDSPAFLEADVIVLQIAQRRLGEIISFIP